jgi:hypothetical protein
MRACMPPLRLLLCLFLGLGLCLEQGLLLGLVLCLVRWAGLRLVGRVAPRGCALEHGAGRRWALPRWPGASLCPDDEGAPLENVGRFRTPR